MFLSLLNIFYVLAVLIFADETETAIFLTNDPVLKKLEALAG